MDYDFRTLDTQDDSEANTEALKAWLHMVNHGFHEGAPDELFQKVWLESMRADRQRVTGAWLPEGEFGASARPVGTFAAFDKTINAGLDLIGVHMITDITVSPAHRRRGLLNRLMLDDLAATDCPVAALTVSEASIYGRFGFGAATFRRRIEVDTTKLAFRSYVDPGRCELMEPADMWPIVSDLFDRFHRTTRGSLDRPHFYRAMLTGEIDFASGSGPDSKLRGAVHLDAQGEPDGYAQWKVLDGQDGKPKPVQANLLSLNGDAHLGLWQFLAGIDLTDRVTDGASRPDDILDWSVSNADAITLKGGYDHIWIRVLDVPVALEARPWFADDRLVLGIDDPLGRTHGAYTVAASGGRAKVEETDDAPDVTVSAETLGSLYLGGVSVRTLARAGRVSGSEESVSRLAALMDDGTSPYALTSF